MDKATLPLVCICIPTYNAEKTIAATLSSILNQTYKNLIIQLVDNDSTDNTVKVIQSFKDGRIVLHRNSLNVGGEGNFNRCIELAKGKYTAIYHADDIYEPQMVAVQVAFLEKYPQAGAVFTEAMMVDEFDQLIGEIHQPANLAKNGPLHNFQSLFKAILEYSNFLICPSVMVRTEIYKNEIKSWRGELFGSSADLDVWLRIVRNHPIGVIPQSMMRYRISRSQVSANVRLDIRRAAFFKVIDYYLNQDDVRNFLSAEDIENYERLERRDKLMRAVNALLLGQADQAVELCPDVFSMSAVKSALHDRRGLSVFVLGLYLKTLLFLRWISFAKVSLAYIKKILNK